tara:strand:+ start:1672 stop:2535 length:864 start_codon:yes stop_codon:yes gene_type:complete
MSFIDIPDNIFESYISPYLLMIDICRISQVSKICNHFGNLNNIWKNFYLYTIHIKWKINDDSIHIGGPVSSGIQYLKTKKCNAYDPINNFIKHTSYYNDYNNFKQHMKQYGQDGYCIHIIPKDPFNCISYPSIYNGKLNCNCYPKNFIPPNWSNIRQSNEPIELIGHNMGVKNGKKKLKKITKEAWIYYNQMNGYSEKNLCQNPKHYIIDTLDKPETYMKSDNYKKIVMKKLATKEKKKITPYNQEIKKLNRQIADANRKLDELNLKKNEVLSKRLKHEHLIQKLLQ